jgi:hypothetical protein
MEMQDAKVEKHHHVAAATKNLYLQLLVDNGDSFTTIQLLNRILYCSLIN